MTENRSRVQIPAIEWRAETDPSELAEWEASQWITGECLGFTLRIREWRDDEDDGRITLRIMHDKYDDAGWVDTVDYDSIDEAKESAIATVQATLEGDLRLYYSTRYADALATVREYASNVECVDLSAGYWTFWGKFANGLEVGVANNDMDGVISNAPELFATNVYRDGEFLGLLENGTLAEQLAKVAKGEWIDEQASSTESQ